MKLDDLAHDVRNGLAGIKMALRYCERECPRTFHRIEVRQEIKMHCSRIERAFKIYERAMRDGEVFPR